MFFSLIFNIIKSYALRTHQHINYLVIKMWVRSHYGNNYDSVQQVEKEVPYNAAKSSRNIKLSILKDGVLLTIL